MDPIDETDEIESQPKKRTNPASRANLILAREAKQKKAEEKRLALMKQTELKESKVKKSKKTKRSCLSD